MDFLTAMCLAKRGLFNIKKRCSAAWGITIFLLHATTLCLKKYDSVVSTNVDHDYNICCAKYYRNRSTFVETSYMKKMGVFVETQCIWASQHYYIQAGFNFTASAFKYFMPSVL